MSGRYSRILASARYYSAIDQYIQYVSGTKERQTRIGQGEPRPASIRLFLQPFGQDLPTAQRVMVSAAQPSWNTYASAFTGRTSATAPAEAENLIRLKDFRPARVSIRTGMSNQATVKRSRVTNLPYGSYGGRSTSVPFGRQNASDTMVGAFTALETAVGANLSGNFSVSLIRERLAS